MKVLLTICFVSFTFLSIGFAQTAKPQIDVKVEGNEYVFTVKNPPNLTAIKGISQKPFCRYHWEFGDGQYSSKEFVARHRYAKKGSYNVRLYLTPCYTNDFVEPLKELPVNVTVTAVSLPLSMKSAIGITTSDNPREGEDMVAIVSYRSMTAGVSTGTLLLFFNEKSVSKQGKVLNTEGSLIRNHNGEKQVLTSNVFDNDYRLSKAKKDYVDCLIFELPQMTTSTQNIFITFKNNPAIFNMLNKYLTMKAAVVANGKTEIAELSVRVEKSHDPNDMDAYPSTMSFRNIMEKEFAYRIRFQNTGEGKVRSVVVTANRPEQTTGKVELLDYSPKCPICPLGYEMKNGSSPPCLDTIFGKDTLEFRFYNINVLGTRQKGVEDETLTEGFVKYRLVPKRGIVKTPVSSKATINFNGELKRTNTASVAFAPGLSFGPKAGVTYDPQSKSMSYFVGMTVSGYKPHGLYLQMEILMDVASLKKNQFYLSDSMRVKVSNDVCQDCNNDTLRYITEQTRQSTFSIIPAQIRWDVNEVLTFGSGVSADLYFRKIDAETTVRTRHIQADQCTRESIVVDPTIATRNETAFNLTLFGDVGVGVGSFKLGARYLMPLGKERNNYYQFYATYKF